jgi:hypothetical protein
MHYTSVGRDDNLNIVVHQNIQLLGVIVMNVLDSYHLPIMFSILYPVRIRATSDPVEKLMNWEQFHWYFQIYKFVLVMKLIKQDVISQPL